jgi:outer membrane protein assembly factor BamB
MRGRLKAYRQRTGALEWTAPEVKDATAVKIHGDVALVYEGNWADPNTFVPTVRALDAATGRQLWSFATGEKYTGSAWAVEKSQSDGDLLILPCSSKLDGPFTLRVVDLHTGAAKFQFSLDAVDFTISGGVVYAVDGKQIVGIDPMSGTVLWRSAPFTERPATPFSGAGFVYAGNRHSLSAWTIQ